VVNRPVLGVNECRDSTGLKLLNMVRVPVPPIGKCNPLTKKAGKNSAFVILKRIIQERKIIASTPEGGYIKGKQRASCFTETPVT